jgi:tetratricopeptide (TPR) repeat protein
MTRIRLLSASIAAATAAVVSLLGGALADSPDSPSGGHPLTTRADQSLLGELLADLSRADTATYVRRLEGRIAADPADATGRVLLGFAYGQRARETGDPIFYTLAERAFRAAAAAAGMEALATTGLATVAVSRHRFENGARLARAALRMEPDDAVAQGALGDALLNLGRYQAAFAAYDRMAELSPSVASYGRIAHARELLGHPGAAAEALKLALALDVPVAEHRAAALVQVGNVRFNVGRLATAKAAYAAALAALPGYVHARAGLARVAGARGLHDRAAALLDGVLATLPLPQYAIWRGEELAAGKRRTEARKAYDLVGAIQRLQAANGIRTDLQSALFDLDQGRRVGDALSRARHAYIRAPSVAAADTLAWALVRNGRCAEALTRSREALRLGTRDALFVFHRGMAERCVGRAADARSSFRRALTINPHFSLRWGPVARRYAA